MRQIEVYRCWDDHTWDTEFVEIPDDTPEDGIALAAEHAALEDLRNSADLPVAIGVYHIPEEEDSDDPTPV